MTTNNHHGVGAVAGAEGVGDGGGGVGGTGGSSAGAGGIDGAGGAFTTIGSVGAGLTVKVPERPLTFTS